MRKNCMAEVAKALGLELEEVFRIDGDKHYFRLTDTGLGMSMCSENKNWFVAPINALNGLLLGENEIIKLPWRPQEDEKYYVPFIATKPINMYDEHYWLNEDIDMKRYRMGLVCQTKEEAVALTKKMLTVPQEVRDNG